MAHALPVHIRTAVQPWGFPPAADPVKVTMPVDEFRGVLGVISNTPMSDAPPAPVRKFETIIIVKT